MKEYNRLVRDFIPQMIEVNDNIVFYHILSRVEYIDELDKKLKEEVVEYQ